MVRSGLALRALGELDEAREAFLEAEGLGCREAIAGRGCVLIDARQFEAGFEGYEARWIAGRSLAEVLGLRFPWWRGPGTASERVVVFNDHGLGDTIQFCRAICLMMKAAARPLMFVVLQAASSARAEPQIPLVDEAPN